MKTFKILVTEYLTHPICGGISSESKEFFDLGDAEDYYNERVEKINPEYMNIEVKLIILK